MRRHFREALMSAGTVVILLLVLIACDDNVRDQFSKRFVAHPSIELASAERQGQAEFQGQRARPDLLAPKGSQGCKG